MQDETQIRDSVAAKLIADEGQVVQEDVKDSSFESTSDGASKLAYSVASACDSNLVEAKEL